MTAWSTILCWSGKTDVDKDSETAYTASRYPSPPFQNHLHMTGIFKFHAYSPPSE